MVTDILTTCVLVIFRVKVICIMSVGVIKLWLLTWLVNYVAMLLVVCQLSHDVIGLKTRNVIVEFQSVFCLSLTVFYG